MNRLRAYSYPNRRFGDHRSNLHRTAGQPPRTHCTDIFIPTLRNFASAGISKAPTSFIIRMTSACYQSLIRPDDVLNKSDPKSSSKKASLIQLNSLTSENIVSSQNKGTVYENFRSSLVFPAHSFHLIFSFNSDTNT